MSEKKPTEIEQAYKANLHGSVAANKKIIEAHGTDAAVILGELLSRQKYFSENERLDSEGYFFNSIGDLRSATGLGRRTQERVLPQLVRAGLLTVKSPKGRARRYKINLPEVIKLCNHVQNGQGKDIDHVQNGHTTMSKMDTEPCPKRTTNNVFNNDDNNESTAPNFNDNKNPKPGGKKEVPELNQLIALYIESFEKATGYKPHITKGKDHAIFKRVINEQGIERAKELLKLYFANANDFIKKRGYPVGLFSEDLNSLLIKLIAKEEEDRKEEARQEHNQRLKEEARRKKEELEQERREYEALPEVEKARIELKRYQDKIKMLKPVREIAAAQGDRVAIDKLKEYEQKERELLKELEEAKNRQIAIYSGGKAIES